MKDYIEGRRRIPADPERIVRTLSDNKVNRCLQKFRHYAFTLLGTQNMAILEKRHLMVVPKTLVEEYLKLAGK